MTEPTPPPERPLPDDARARIRAELLAHAHDNRSGGPRWAVPAGAAAAAVALVAGLGWWAVSAGREGDTDDAPITGGGTATASAEPTSAEPSVGSPEPSVGSPEPTTAQPPSEVGAGPCAVELEHVLKGAQLAFAFPDGATSYYLRGDEFVLCDVRDGTTTVHQPLPLSPRDDVSTYAVSTLHQGNQTIRVAGGIMPEGAPDFVQIAYTFPDGHVEHARRATDSQGRTWWRMVHAYEDGGGNELEQPPIEVTVSYSGVQHRYALEYGVDTCAQANHGC